MTFNVAQNLVVCDWVELSRSEYLTIERQVPPKDASTEEKRKAQKERARKSGIEALENKGENLSFPKGDPTVLRLYGDSSNLKFPLGRSNNKLNLNRANNARTRFKQFADTYTKTKSKRVVHNRIVKAQLAAGANPGFDPDDPLDKLLDKSVKDKLQRKKTKRSGAVKISFEIIERQEDKQLVTGIVMDPVNVDAFGNSIPDPELIERIAFGFMAKFQDIGTDHASKRGDPELVVVESFVARGEWKIGNATVPEGAWVLTVRVMDEKTWERVKRGELNGFSLEGVFVRVPIKKTKGQQKKAA
jgi:hypothetical protein